MKSNQHLQRHIFCDTKSCSCLSFVSKFHVDIEDTIMMACRDEKRVEEPRNYTTKPITIPIVALKPLLV